MLEILHYGPYDFGSTEESKAFNAHNVNIVINFSIKDVENNPNFISNSTHDGFSRSMSSANNSSPIFHEAPISYVMSSLRLILEVVKESE